MALRAPVSSGIQKAAQRLKTYVEFQYPSDQHLKKLVHTLILELVVEKLHNEGKEDRRNPPAR